MKKILLLGKRLIIYCTLFLLNSTALTAQSITRYNTFSYGVNEGLLQSTIADLDFDKENFCWISFSNGIQRFDGKSFTNIPMQAGLPDDKMVSFFRCQNGDLLIRHAQGISKYELPGNKFVQIFNYASVQLKNQLTFVGEDDNNIYFLEGVDHIDALDNRTYKLKSRVETGITESYGPYPKPKVSDNIIAHKVAILVSSSIYQWDLEEQKITGKTDSIPYLWHTLVHLKTPDEVMFNTWGGWNSLQGYDFRSNKFLTYPIAVKDKSPFRYGAILNWQHKTLISKNEKLYEADDEMTTIRNEFTNFQNQSIGGTSPIWLIKEDNFGNLYMVTVMKGIRKLIRQNYPVKYYGSEKKENNFITSILPDKINNRILAGTSANGLLIFDTLQHLIKAVNDLPGKKREFTVNHIVKTATGDYLLYITGEKNLWNLGKDLQKLTPVSIATTTDKEYSGIDYFGNFIFQDGSHVMVQTQGKIYNTLLPSKATTEYLFTRYYTMSGILFNNRVISHANDELLYIDTQTFKVIKKIPFPNTSYVRCFAKNNGYIFIGSNNGIFKIDSTGKIYTHLTKENGLPDNCIYAMIFDRQGNLWCSTNQGIFKLNNKNEILQLRKEDGLQENEFNTNIVAASPDGELFFGGVNGVSSFYPEMINTIVDDPSLLFTKIKVNNEEMIIDNKNSQQTIDLAYNKNSLSFDFIATGPDNANLYVYQYKMKGVDEKWIQNENTQTVRYYLSPGNYTFQIYASRSFDKDAKPIKEINIIIHPPFWKTWWFLTVMVLAGIILSALAINRYNRNKYKEKLQRMENEHKIQLERERISRDLHDSIGAYANAVLYKTDLLQAENISLKREELMKDLKFASKDIITSLRETIWALKKDQYSAQECLLRISNFIQPLSRYYNYIHFNVHGNAPEGLMLHYTHALNLVRMIQEATSNALKHSGAKNITLTSSMEYNRWKLLLTDDGKGFDQDTTSALQTGNGLENLKQRSKESGFELTITSHEDTGTAIQIIV